MKKIIACLTSLILFVGCSTSEPIEVHTTQKFSEPSYFVSSKEDATSYIQTFDIFSTEKIEDIEGDKDGIQYSVQVQADTDTTRETLMRDYGSSSSASDIANNNEYFVYLGGIVSNEPVDNETASKLFTDILKGCNNENTFIYTGSQPYAMSE